MDGLARALNSIIVKFFLGRKPRCLHRRRSPCLPYIYACRVPCKLQPLIAYATRYLSPIKLSYIKRTRGTSSVNIALYPVVNDLIEQPEPIYYTWALVKLSHPAFLYCKLMYLAVMRATLNHVPYLARWICIWMSRNASCIYIVSFL